MKEELEGLKGGREGTPSRDVFKSGMALAGENVHALREENDALVKRVEDKEDRIFELEGVVEKMEWEAKERKREHERVVHGLEDRLTNAAEGHFGDLEKVTGELVEV